MIEWQNNFLQKLTITFNTYVSNRFASFNKAFDLHDKTQEPLPDSAFREEDKQAPIAKLESLDELDLVSKFFYF